MNPSCTTMDKRTESLPVMQIQVGQNTNKNLLHSIKFLISIFFQWAISGFLWDAENWEIYFLLWVFSITVFRQKIQLLKMSTSFFFLYLPSFPLLLRIGGRKSAKVQKFRWKAMKCSRRKQRKKVDYPRKVRVLSGKCGLWKQDCTSSFPSLCRSTIHILSHLQLTPNSEQVIWQTKSALEINNQIKYFIYREENWWRRAIWEAG